MGRGVARRRDVARGRRDGSRRRRPVEEDTGLDEVGLRLEGTRRAVQLGVEVLEHLFGDIGAGPFAPSRDGDGRVGLVYGRAAAPAAGATLTSGADAELALSGGAVAPVAGDQVEIRLRGTREVTSLAAAMLRGAVDVLKVSKFYENGGPAPTGRVYVTATLWPAIGSGETDR